ncbi:hypothetical protein L1887_55815 [Cichorium endivia]|nr:hypothetical protein L1887_55815 [Cichorium endivia]
MGARLRAFLYLAFAAQIAAANEPRASDPCPACTGWSVAQYTVRDSDGNCATQCQPFIIFARSNLVTAGIISASIVALHKLLAWELSAGRCEELSQRRLSSSHWFADSDILEVWRLKFPGTLS